MGTTTTRVTLLTLLLMIAPAIPVHALPINVAEFRWDAIEIDPGVACDPLDPFCSPIEATFLSLFSLTNIWDGEIPGPTLFNNRLSLPGSEQLWSTLAPPFPIGGINFEQLFELGVIPGIATASISFLVGDDLVTLTASLLEPNTSVVLQFEAAGIPEPTTLGLMGVGLLIFGRALASRRH
ncbi:MAG TPA: PEP-CTERM sorting domain-containing protein [Vicinamibacterales bacterium]|jgi:hypothetical protein